MQATNKWKKNACGNHEEESHKKERHIVTWTQLEDDILRQQISLNGTENWAIIASKFKDKTTRQCRRRWYTYLNSDFKKGGWSPEEDMLLCEAQKIFGNRWTEIAKVVSGRTDNAVKNRFSTLCKKRAKYEALAKENKNTHINLNNKRIMLHNGLNGVGAPESDPPIKKIRKSHIPGLAGNCNFGDRSHPQCGNHQPRPPFAVLAQNFHNVNVASQHHASGVKEVSIDVQNSMIQRTFLKKDDPKITALVQQAELLGSLALKVSEENTGQSMENAWKVLQDFLNRSKENDLLGQKICDIDFKFHDFKDLIEDLRSINDGSRPSWRQLGLYEESPASSEYSTGSTQLPYPAPDKTEQTQAEIGALHEDIETEMQMVHIEEHFVGACGKEVISSANITQVEMFPSCDEQTKNDIFVSASSSTEFSSPLQVTPLFRSLSAGIPSPKFSESDIEFAVVVQALALAVRVIALCVLANYQSLNGLLCDGNQVITMNSKLGVKCQASKLLEDGVPMDLLERNFLLKTLGVESPCPSPSINPLQPPLCKRALLQSL
ncbi:MYB PROTEIN-RELATED [Salix koriyanagi]|uniref:MYB PROTEIN-RELATED n=1 Tax=Salix koriyanagi TaxID=2511006 RepID=A0A9Q1AHX8_9ROSI|nr:MYB PROTEIN-RELATED [Salix koriyanagi]